MIYSILRFDSIFKSDLHLSNYNIWHSTQCFENQLIIGKQSGPQLPISSWTSWDCYVQNNLTSVRSASISSMSFCLQQILTALYFLPISDENKSAKNKFNFMLTAYRLAWNFTSRFTWGKGHQVLGGEGQPH